MLTIREQTPSGNNDRFTQGHLSFADYIAQMREVIAQSRFDLTTDNRQTVIDANAPFEYRPENFDGKHGVLFVHGLFGSPFFMQAIAKQFCQRGYLARAILLPGHGTIPGDLLHVRAEDWNQAIQYGIDSLSADVEHVHYVGFSLGGLLGIYHALRKEPFASLGLIAPACHMNNTIRFYNRLYQIKRWLMQEEQWVWDERPWDYARYINIPLNAAKQLQRMIDNVTELSASHTITMPIRMLLSEDDETIDAKAALDLFTQQHHPDSRLLYYTNSVKAFDDQRIISRGSAQPDSGILDFSHVCMNFPSDDRHYGWQGDYVDAISEPEQVSDERVYRGALSRENLKRYRLRRVLCSWDFMGGVEVLLGGD